MVEGGQRQLVAELTGHDGPVWQVCWAHPRYGNILASCSYDRQVFVWKEFSPNQWGQIYAYQALEGSVNAIAWSPHEFGLCLACASSDETVAVLSWQADDVWEVERFKAHRAGVNSVAWAPPYSATTLQTPSADAPLKEKRLATGGCDNQVKLWRCEAAVEGAPARWVEETPPLPKAHTDWVRDVAWAPALGFGGTMLASCSQDKKVPHPNPP